MNKSEIQARKKERKEKKKLKKKIKLKVKLNFIILSENNIIAER